MSKQNQTSGLVWQHLTHNFTAYRPSGSCYHNALTSQQPTDLPGIETYRFTSQKILKLYRAQTAQRHTPVCQFVKRRQDADSYIKGYSSVQKIPDS